MAMKETIELEQCNTTVRFPKMIVVPKPKEFIRGGTAALVNILCPAVEKSLIS